MNYQEQLETKEWKNKREAILKRDDYKCTKCGVERPKYLGISRKLGVLEYEEYSRHGKAFFDKENNTAYLMLYPGLTLYARSEVDLYCDVSKTNPKDIKFAEQTKDGKMRLICFADDFTNKDLKPDLNIHHKYYIVGKKAWEYNDDALITLCVDCHQEEHLNSEIFVYTENGNLLSKTQVCIKCSGSGHLKEYNYYCDGVCFDCHGNGVLII